MTDAERNQTTQSKITNTFTKKVLFILFQLMNIKSPNQICFFKLQVELIAANKQKRKSI